jgi:LysR family transcriptional regulator, low CO2-responsive transcriptional regulator
METKIAMQYTQLRAFHAVAKHGGFSRAAQAIGLTQPALSDQVSRLEHEFGVTLFRRHARAVDLTELGLRLQVVTKQMFDLETTARELLESAGTLQSGTLMLAADAPDLAIELAAALRSRYPGVLVTVSIANAESCMERVLSSSVDAAVTAAAQIDNRVNGRVLRRDPLAAMLPTGHPLAGKESLTFAEFAAQPVIFREGRSMTQRLLEHELAQHDLRVAPVMLVEGREALQQAVAYGVGVGLIATGEFGGDTRIALVPIEDCQAVMVEQLVRLADRPPSALLDALFELAAEGDTESAARHEVCLNSAVMRP